MTASSLMSAPAAKAFGPLPVMLAPPIAASAPKLSG